MTTPTSPSIDKQLKQLKLRHSSGLPQLAKIDGSKSARDVYDAILWRIDSKSFANDTVAVGLTGCSRKSGASTIATNLALLASSSHHSGRVLLIDANWELPGLKKTFELAPSHGLYDILAGETSPRECEPQPVSEYLDILCRGKYDEEYPVHIQPKLVDDMLADYKTQYNLILVDLPSAAELRCALPLARKLDGTLLVTRFESVKQPQAQRVLRGLTDDGVEVWGSVLNRHREYVPRWLRRWL